MRRAALLAAVLLAASCATRQPLTGQETTGVDRKLSTFAFIEEGKLATLIVGTRPTRYRDNEKYVPVEVAIANRGVRQFSLTRESFTLADDKGNRYPCASPKELLANYDLLDLDRNLAELEGIVYARFGAMTSYPSKFSPTRTLFAGGDGSVVTDTLQLPKFGYMLDMLYFPMPTTGLRGHTFELSMTAPELTDPIFVKFDVQ